MSRLYFTALISGLLLQGGAGAIEAKIRTGENIDAPIQLSQALADGERSVVIGRIRWIENGKVQKLGTGLFTNMVTLHIYREGSDHRIRAAHAEDGTFAWAMPSGVYRIPIIAFLTSNGNSVMAPGFFRFDVLEGNEVTYVGTLEINTTRKSGFTGWKYKIKDLAIRNECATDCAPLLSRVGIPDALLHESLMEPDAALLERWSASQKAADD